MAKYTVELNDIVKSGTKIFDFEYEFFDNDKKGDFEQKFIDHFLFREIGFETVGRFQHYLKTKCNEVLPYYNMLMETALFEYDLKNNYILTETFTKTNTKIKILSGEVNQNGTTKDTNTANGSVIRELDGSVNRELDGSVVGEKTNILESNTNHTEDEGSKRNDKYKDTRITDDLHTVIVTNKKVGSSTPNGLLKMTDIEGDVYASQADIEAGQTKSFDKLDDQTSKTNEINETKERKSNDDVSASSTDNSNDIRRETSNDVSRESLNETSNNLIGSDGSFNNTANSSQNENDSGSENYTLKREGDIGVDTTPDKLMKHIAFQKIVTTVYTQFFNECDDIFMGIY